MPTRRRAAGLLLAAALSASACSSTATGADAQKDHRIRVVATTGILADLARNVAGDRASVTQMVPDGADPHSWEPSLRTIRDVAYADVALSNYLLLEEHAIIRAMDANLPPNAKSVSVAEEAAKQGATVLPLVEDRSLDTVWLGMRVIGSGRSLGADRSSEVDLVATGVEGPGAASAYLTTSFGEPQVGFASSDGFDEASGYQADTSVLPADAHQHMSWAFTQPGVYRIHFEARLRTSPGAAPTPLGSGTAVFVVGVGADEVAARQGRAVLAAGHADITADLDRGMLTLAADKGAVGEGATPLPAAAPPATGEDGGAGPTGGTGLSAMESYSLDDIVIDVPTRTLTQVPGTGYRFVGEPGSDVYMLPQAVLGKHVHGEIDPHLWHDAHNAAAYVRVIRDALTEADPASADEYQRNAAAYLARLDGLDAEVQAEIARIPPERRRLVTTNDAFGYLARAYGLEVSGFVAPNPGVEPSVADRVRLQATLTDLRIPAVFLEPNLARTRSTLRTAAEDAGVRVCPLYGDTLDANAPTYIDMMRFNAHSLATCLGDTEQETP